MELRRYRKKFSDLFTSEANAVTLYLSLERRYSKMVKHNKRQNELLGRLPRHHQIFKEPYDI